MRYYLRWWTNGTPGSPLPAADEVTARAKIRSNYPTAQFSSWQSALHSPSAMQMSGIDDQMFAWEDKQVHANNQNPVADILRAS